MSIVIAGAAPSGVGVDVRSIGTQLLASSKITEWWRGHSADVTIVSNKVNTFVSRKTSTRNPTQATGALQASISDGVLTDPYKAGVTYSAALFSGAQTYACGSAGAFAMGSPYTWGIIFKVVTNPTSNGYMFGNFESSGVVSDTYVTSGGYVGYRQGNGIISKPHILNSWNIAIMGHDGAYVYLDVNGVAATPVATNNSVSTTAITALGAVGSSNGNSGFNGYISDLLVFNGSPATCADEVILMKKMASELYGISVVGV